MTLVGPLASGSRPTGRARIHDRCCAVDRNGAEDTLRLVGSDDTLESIDGPGVLCKDPPCKLEAAKEDLAAGLQSIASGYVEGHRVGRVSAVGTDGFGDGGGKFGEHALCRRGSFDPIKPSGQHQHVDNFDLALTAPWSVAKAEAELGGFVDALVECSAKSAST